VSIASRSAPSSTRFTAHLPASGCAQNTTRPPARKVCAVQLEVADEVRVELRGVHARGRAAATLLAPHPHREYPNHRRAHSHAHVRNTRGRWGNAEGWGGLVRPCLRWSPGRLLSEFGPPVWSSVALCGARQPILPVSPWCPARHQTRPSTHQLQQPTTWTRLGLQSPPRRLSIGCNRLGPRWRHGREARSVSQGARLCGGSSSTHISHRVRQLRCPRNIRSNKVVQSPVKERTNGWC